MDGMLNNKLLINCCLTGCVHYKKDNPKLPITPEEIARDVESCHNLGAQIFHIHARDNDETPTWKKDNYQHIVDAIRDRCPEVILCVSTSGRHWSDIDQRAECLDCSDIDMGSLTLGSMNFYKSVSNNHPDIIRELLIRMNNKGIKPELEIFDIGHLFFAHRLIKEGLLHPPYYFNVLLGSPWSMPLSIDVVSLLIRNLPSCSIFSFAGIGKFQYEANLLGLLYANGIRIGLEDNLKMGDELTTNENLVNRITLIADVMNRRLATMSEAGEILR